MTSGLFFSKDRTAQGVAKQRLIESLAQPDKRIINDPYAEKFVLGAEFIKLLGHRLNVWLAQWLIPGFHEHLIARTRLVDDFVERSAVDGVEQYVILGAGYDSRAHRLRLPSSLRVFEVDQQEVQARKRAKLRNEFPNLKAVTYVAIDFTHQSIADQLIKSGFDQSKSTVFTLEGVSQYITKEALTATIAEVAMLVRDARSVFFLSYASDLLSTDPVACFGKGYPRAEMRARLITYLSAKVGEPWVAFYRADEIENTLSQNGYRVKENLTLKDLNSRYLAPVGRTLAENQLLQLEHLVIAQSHVGSND